MPLHSQVVGLGLSICVAPAVAECADANRMALSSQFAGKLVQSPETVFKEILVRVLPLA